jgi:hypothetical protein
MRKHQQLSLIAALALAGSVLAAGAADAQSRRGGASTEGPGHPCRPAAQAFDQALGSRIGAAVGAQAGAQFGDATQMRNQGMEACLAGRIEEGRRMIQQATQALRS